MARKLFAQIGTLILSSALGIAVAYAIEHEVLLKEGCVQLMAYANRLERIDDEFGQQNMQAIMAVADDNLPPCSDQDLAFMRDYVFRSSHIRDIGRVKDNRLYCSTGIGRLPAPSIIQPPDISSRGLNIYSRSPLMISKKSTGFIIQFDGVSVVLNPESYDYLDEPPMHFSAPLYDKANHRLLEAFGRPMPLTADEAVAGKLMERDGIFYQPLCSQQSMNCVIAAEARRDMLNRGRGLLRILLVGGALLGAAVALIGIQYYQRQRSMESQLRRAIRRGDLTLAYQPIVNLETGAIVGAEALVRWTDEDGQFVRPDIFVSLAEERGFVGEITRLVAQRVADELRDLLATGKFRVTLNIASADLTDPGFFAHLKGCMAAAHVAPSSIGLELTERSTADQDTAVQALAKFKNSGHVVYIDDFGTGYSSLAYLHRLQVDAIKVDRAFTQTVGTEAVTASVVPQILAMAAQLDLLVVVEGIETREQADYFRAAGRGILGQGWLFGKPMPAEQFRKLLR